MEISTWWRSESSELGRERHDGEEECTIEAQGSDCNRGRLCSSGPLNKDAGEDRESVWGVEEKDYDGVNEERERNRLGDIE